MLCLLFPIRKWIEYSIETPKIQKKKRVSTLRYINSSLLKEFKRFITASSCELSLENEYLDNL